MRRSANAIGLLALVTLFWMTQRALSGPDRLTGPVPTHFDFAGRPNAWGSPAMLWLLPVIALAMFALLSVVGRLPMRLINLPVAVTDENLPRIRSLLGDLLAALWAELACTFLLIQWAAIRAARYPQRLLPGWLLPLTVGVILLTTLSFVVAMRRTARSC